MSETLSVEEARERLAALAGKMARTRDAVAITRDGQPVMALVSWELYESIVQTLSVLNDPRVIAALREVAQGPHS